MSTQTQAKPAAKTDAPKAKAPEIAKTITVLVPNNPKKVNSASRARFDLYKTGMTVDAYREAVKAAGQPLRLAAADLLWDVRHKFIEVK